jgi:hypothetical protein
MDLKGCFSGPEIKAKRQFLNISEGYLMTGGEQPYGLSDET